MINMSPYLSRMLVRGDFVLLFTIDWPLVDVSNFIYSVSTT
ncbi:Os07g0284950 [Oryza sativa Japonica Group]|uniref:Os07g0284950 protein n=1 Tax=Oryza sativa subsp. japonica TaxID=39947 RepID=A0A0P0X4W1_ORYSJ|nr:Os07g0284950 [Oryza sativa Japonica Group]